MMKKILLLALAMILLMGCQSKENIMVNDEINEKITKQYNDIMSTIATAITENDKEQFMSVLATGTEAYNEVYFNQFVNEGTFSKEFFVDKIEEADLYYVQDITQTGESIEFPIDNYSFILPSTDGQEGSRLIAFVKGQFGEFQLMLTIIFNEDDGDLRLERFTLGDLKPVNDTVDDLIQQARDLETEGYHISAWQYYGIASKFFQPSVFLQYDGIPEVQESMKSLAAVLDETIQLPLEVSVDDETYKIFNVGSNIEVDGNYCRVVYVSNLPENMEQEMIRDEAKKVHEVAQTLITGLGKGFEGRILYTAYFEEPTDSAKEYYTVTVNIEE